MQNARTRRAAKPLVALALAGSSLAPAAIGMTTVVAGISFASSASAAQTKATNVTSTMNLADGSVIDVNSAGAQVTFNYSLPSGAQPGDTTVITLESYEAGTALNGLQVKDQRGVVIGTVSGSGTNYVVTYTSAIAGLVNVDASVTIPVTGGNSWPSGTKQPIVGYVDGTKTSPGSLIFNSASTPTPANVSGAAYPDSSSAIPAIGAKLVPASVQAGDIGQTVTSAIQIDPATQPYLAYDCSMVNSPTFDGVYTLFDSTGVDGSYKYNSTYHFGAGAPAGSANPWNVKVTGCTPTTITYTYVVPQGAEGQGIQLNVQTLHGDNSAAKLTAKAVAEQYTGPYKFNFGVTGNVSFAANAPGYGLDTTYAFSGANGSGTAYPTATPDTATTKFNTPVTTNVVANDQQSVLGNAISPAVKVKDSAGNFGASATTANGTYTPDGKGGITFTPKAGFVGTDTVTYQITDAGGMTATSTYTVTVTAATPPTAVDDTFTTKFGTPATINVSANDKLSADGTSFTGVKLLDASGAAVSTLTTAQGTFTVSGLNVVFTPKAGFSGPVPAASYQITDNNGKTATAKITGTVTAAAAPTAADDTFTTKFNTPVTFDVGSNDKLSADATSFTGVQFKDASGASVSTLTTAQGTFTVSGTKVTFTPKAGFSGPVPSVAYVITDNNGQTATANITGTVTAAAAPTAVDDQFTTPFNKPYTFDATANDKLSADATSFVDVKFQDASGAPVDTLTIDGQGTFTHQGTKVTFTPAPGYTGGTSVEYRAIDNNGKYATAFITGQVGAAVSPTAVNDTFSTGYKTPVTIDVTANDKLSVDGKSFTKIQLTDPSGVLTDTYKVEGEGTYQVDGLKVIFTPVAGFSGPTRHGVEYIVTDNNGKTARAQISGTVADASASAATDDSFTTKFGTPVTIDVTANDQLSKDATAFKTVQLKDASGKAVDTLTVKEGTFKVDGLKVVFTPAAGYFGPVPAVNYVVTDDNGKTATAKITGVVETPAAPTAADDTFTTKFNTPVTFDVSSNDKLSADGKSWKNVQFKDASGAAVDTLTVKEGVFTHQGVNVTFTPAKGFSGAVPSVTYVITDDNGQTAEAKINVTVEKLPAPPAKPGPKIETDYVAQSGDATDYAAAAALAGVFAAGAMYVGKHRKREN